MCPKCKKPVPPGYKFCEACGTRLWGPFTCSHCGTQFFTPVTHCDLCGARIMIPDPEPEGEASVADETFPVMPDAEEPDEQPGGDPAGPDPAGRSGTETTVTETGMYVHPHYPEIREPDTDDILEQFGDEDEEEPGPAREIRSPQKSPVQKPGPARSASLPGARGSDNALFLRDEQPAGLKTRPAGRATGKVWIVAGAFILVLVLAGILLFLLPAFTAGSGPAVPGPEVPMENTTRQTPLPVTGTATVRTITPVPAVTAVSSLVTLPTQEMPAGQKVYFLVDKNPVTAKIFVTFTGSAGSGSISSADVTVTHPDGAVATSVLLPLKGINEISLSGSRGADRVEIIAMMSTGEKYRVFDALVPYRGD